VMDAEMHKHGTGVSNERILANAKMLSKENVDIIVRMPVIPSINAEEQNMVKTAEFLRDFPRLQYVEMLPYHDLGVEKYTSLGRSSQTAIFEVPSKEQMESLAEPFKAAGIHVIYGSS